VKGRVLKGLEINKAYQRSSNYGGFLIFLQNILSIGPCHRVEKNKEQI
jgi:hypothetical protein